MKKILHIYKDYYPPIVGGIEKHINTICESLKEEFEIKVLVANRKPGTETEIINGVEVVKVGSLGRFFSAPLSPLFPSYLKKLKADILEFHLPNPTAVISYLLKKPPGKVLVFYHSDIVRQKWAMKGYGGILRRFLKLADKIIATTPRYIETSEYLLDFRDKCVAIPIGIYTSLFSKPDLKSVD